MRMTKIALKRMHTKKEFIALMKKCEMKPVTIGGTNEDNSDLDESQFRAVSQIRPPKRNGKSEKTKGSTGYWWDFNPALKK